MTEPTSLTFEEGYTRLQAISTRVTSEEVPVAEMCDLFAEGKGLQKSLTEYLDQQKSRVEAIDRGEGVQPFQIVAPSASGAPAVQEASASLPAPATPVSAADDDIPF